MFLQNKIVLLLLQQLNSKFEICHDFNKMSDYALDDYG